MNQRGYLEHSKVDAALATLADVFQVVVPLLAPGEDAVRLATLPATGSVALDNRKPLLPLKTLFLPVSEELFRYVHRKQEITEVPTVAMDRERVVVGALACDISALALLDRVFLAEPADESYRERRDGTTIVAMACSGDGAGCFCASTGIDPLRPAGSDALLTPTPAGFVVEALDSEG